MSEKEINEEKVVQEEQETIEQEEQETVVEASEAPGNDANEDLETKEDEVPESEKELVSLKDKHIRLQAEFDNFRRRTIKEKADLIKTGGEQVLKNIIPVIDDLDRAMMAFNNVDEDDPLKQGISLIYGKFQDFLKQNGISEIDALEKDFDTDLHEALTKIPAPTEELKGKVVDVITKGYLLHDKVVRFAKVVVGE
ncbi:MAG: nucleotide exchange factor GrpE [Mangrovibacterium sp.]